MLNERREPCELHFHHLKLLLRNHLRLFVQVMPTKIRLARFGCRNLPFYRIVVADSRAPRDGKFIEIVGSYNPLPNKEGVKEVRFKTERVKYWLGTGAQPSDKTAWLLGKAGILPLPPQRFSAKKMLPKKKD